MTIKEILLRAQASLRHHSYTVELDAALLLCFSLGVTRDYLFAYPEKELPLQQTEAFFQRVSRRVAGEPMAYILGVKEFWNITLHVSPDTLIPRPETELLVELLLRYLPQGEKQTVVDLGTGSGAIALALAASRPLWAVIATDYSEPALAVAKKNAKQLQLTRVNFYSGKWCDALPPQTRCHAIASNPPYLSLNDHHLLQGDVRFEPRAALVSGADGLDAIRLIAAQAKHYLLPKGMLLLEHGCKQAEAVKSILLRENFRDVRHYKDIAGLDRVTVGVF